MDKQYKICYTATWPDGKLLNPKKPYLEAYIIADNEKQAIAELVKMFPALDVKIVEKPVEIEIMDEDGF